MTALDDARATRARIDDRLTASRLGRSLTREMDQDMLALKEAGAALDTLIAERFESAGDDREDLAYLITARRFQERGLRGVIGEPDIALARPLADFLLAEGFHRQGPITDAQVDAAYDAFYEAIQTAGTYGQWRNGIRAALEAARAVS